MTLHSRSVLSLAVVSLLAACGGGGGDGAPDAGVAATPTAGAQGAVVARLRALAAGGGGAGAAAVIEITNAQFFEWAGSILPDYFPANPAPLSLNIEGLTWDIRAYSTGNFLAVASNGRAYALGPVTGNALVDLGPLQALSEQVCGVVNCTAAGGGGGGGTNTVNECFVPASQALQTGNTTRATFINTVFVGPTTTTSEFNIEARVDGPTTFEGLAAVKTTTTTTELGSTFIQVASTYERAATGGLIETLGTDSEITGGSFVTRIKSVYSPPDRNDEFSLQLGNTFPKKVTFREATSVGGSPLPPLSSPKSTTSTFKFEERETISVLGRSYSTCRYRETDSNGFYQLWWHIVGKGLAARFEQYTAGGTLAGRNELKSATFNGAPL